MTHKSSKIGRWQGAGLMATTLLGTGVFILPQMTIAIAGQGAFVAWLLLTLAIIPITLVFGRLAATFPHAAGPAYFVEQAFGPIAGRTIGLIFLLVVPLGASAAILLTFQFVEPLVTLSPLAKLACELAVLAGLFVVNYRGIKTSATLQFVLTLTIVAVIILLFGASAIQPELVNSDPLVQAADPAKFSLIMSAASIAFWSFLGVEAMTHLASDFRKPKQDLLPAMMIGTLLVGLVYLACTWLLLAIPSVTELAMIGVFDRLLGGYGAQVIGILGIAAGLGAVNVYAASVSRLVWSFSNDGVLPRYFSKLNQHDEPARALGTVLLVMAIILSVTYLSGQDLEVLIAWCNGVFVVIYLATMLAAFKLLSYKNRPLIICGSVFCVALIWSLGERMGYVLLLISVVMPLLWWQLNRQRSLLKPSI